MDTFEFLPYTSTPSSLFSPPHLTPATLTSVGSLLFYQVREAAVKTLAMNLSYLCIWDSRRLTTAPALSLSRQPLPARCVPAVTLGLYPSKGAPPTQGPLMLSLWAPWAVWPGKAFTAEKPLPPYRGIQAVSCGPFRLESRRLGSILGSSPHCSLLV